MDKNHTINEALGVSNERNTWLKAIGMACMFIALQRQTEAGEVEANEGYNLCEGIKNALTYADGQTEACCIGMNSSDLTQTFNELGIIGFINMVKEDYADTDTVASLADKIVVHLNDAEAEVHNKHSFARGISNFPFSFN